MGSPVVLLVEVLVPSTGSLQLFRRKATHKIWLMGVGVPTGGRFNLVVGNTSFTLLIRDTVAN